MRLKIAIGPKAVSKSFATVDVLEMIAWVKHLAAQQLPGTTRRRA